MQDTSGPATELERLRRRNEKLQALLEVSKQLGAEHSVDQLLGHILSEAGRIIEADRCSLFLLDEERRELWTKIAHGLGKEGRIRIPMDKGIVGLCATTLKPVRIDDAYQDPRFNPEVDRGTGYRTRSLLSVPMLDAEGLCTGVIQALNKKDGTSFTAEDEELLLALGGQAAVALENALLHEDIQALFEGFIRASVVAIESRDPTTSGHSERVAVLTVDLAEAVGREPPPPYRGLSFSAAELRELRYASLLHDFGKVGVREQVLVKANKLYPHELELIRHRFDYARKDLEVDFWKRQVEAVRAGGALDAERMQQELERALHEMEELWEFLVACNRPTIVEQKGFGRLQEILSRSILDPRGQRKPLLSERELISLSIPRGSLNPEERAEIESHVTHTFSFLEQIPWTRDLRRVPEIAAKHHEKLNGKGYPFRVGPDQIPVQARMMAIADIYDALTAHDRPYKKALGHEQALDILHTEARQGALDLDLLKVFVEADVPRKIRE